MLCTKRANAEVYLCEAESILANMSENQEVMTYKAHSASAEVVFPMRPVLRHQQPVFNRYAVADMVQMSLGMMWHLYLLIYATKHFNFNEYHAFSVQFTREVFEDLVTQHRYAIRLLTLEGQDCGRIDAAIRELSVICDALQSTLVHSLERADQMFAARAGNGTAFFRTMSNDVPCCEKENDLDATDHVDLEAQIRNDLLSGDSSSNCNGDKSDTPFDCDAWVGANRLAFSNFVFHLLELMQTVENRFASNSAAGAAGTDANNATTTRSNRSMFVTAGRFIKDTIASWSRAVWVWHTEDWHTKSKTGLRTSLLMGVALILVGVPSLARQFERGQWIMLAMLMCQGDNLGGTLYQMRNRFLGTLFGAIFSYFVFIAVGTDHSSITAMFVPFIIFCGVIKQSKQWGYFGSVAIGAAIVVTLGRVAYRDPPPGNYALLRIQENAMGILLALACGLVTIPVLAIDLLKVNIVEVLDRLCDATTKVQAIYQTTVSCAMNAEAGCNGVELTFDETRESKIQENTDELAVLRGSRRLQRIRFIADEGAAVRTRLAAQPLLIEQAAIELVLGTKPFPEEMYQKLICCQRKVLRMLVSMDRALLRISTVSQLKITEPSLQFAERVGKEVTTLLNEVQSNLQLWKMQLLSTVRSGAASSNDAEESDRHKAVETFPANYLEPRAEHSMGMEKLHSAATSLARKGAELNDQIVQEWLGNGNDGAGGNSGVNAVGDIVHGVDGNDDNGEPIATGTGTEHGKGEASLHHMFLILTTFNSLFYASAHLGHATMDLGNVVYTILLLEQKASTTHRF